MISQIKSLLLDSLRNFGRNRLRSRLLGSSDRVLQDMGFSRELLLQGVEAWPWRMDGEKDEARIYRLINKHEQDIERSIRELRSFSDRDLADIGIARCDIETVVRNGREEPAKASTTKKLNKQQALAA